MFVSAPFAFDGVFDAALGVQRHSRETLGEPFDPRRPRRGEAHRQSRAVGTAAGLHRLPNVRHGTHRMLRGVGRRDRLVKVGKEGVELEARLTAT